MHTPAEARLLELLEQRSFKRGEFKLASGGTSDYFIDGKLTTVSSEGAFLVGEVIYERTKDLNVEAIGGIEVGAVPMIAAAVIAYHRHGRAVEGFWVRNKPKDHGTQKLVEGAVKPGSRALIVDDVFTRGQSALRAVEAARAEKNCDVVAVLALVDRRQGAVELFAQHGIADYRPVFGIEEFGVSVAAR